MANQEIKSNKDKSSYQLIKRIFHGYILKHRGMLALAIFAMAVVAVTTAAYARIMEPLVDRVFSSQDTTSIITIPLILILIAVIKAIATFTQSYLMGIFGQKIIADIQNTLFSHLVYSDLSYFNSKSTGSLISNFLNDANLLREGLTKALTGISKDFLTLVFLIILLFYIDFQLALISIIGFPLSVIPVRQIGKKMRKASTQNQERTSDFSSRINEAFLNLRQIKSYTMESEESKKIKQANELRLKAMFKVVKARAAATPIIEILAGIAIALVVFYAAGIGNTGSRLSAGEFITFITALGLSYQPLRSLANLNTALQEGLAAANRIFKLLDIYPKIVDLNNAKDLKITKGEISFKNVFFAFENSESVLKDVSFQIKKGEKLAIVGPSGSGKTTILNLISRFFDLSSGSITIDDQEIMTVTQSSLRKSISLVSQDSILFNDTIKENICYGNASASEKDIIEAAKKANAWDFISQMPLGLNTIVGQSGVKISGGERQRISIARAILKNSPILILDEATSALDNKSETKVQLALNALSKGRTTIVVAHRLSTIADSDKIILINNGKIEESGKHHELLNKGAMYAKLYKKSQSEINNLKN
ncbi:ABC transporter ATP-binding protein/permease [Alphaproteobacteria bacterium]|nr:ABC transporter ATP-binding protein/permease [Alphaproteobacteria bacterium]